MLWRAGGGSRAAVALRQGGGGPLAAAPGRDFEQQLTVFEFTDRGALDEFMTGCVPPQHGLSSDTMARITSDCVEMRSARIKRP